MPAVNNGESVDRVFESSVDESGQSVRSNCLEIRVFSLHKRQSKRPRKISNEKSVCTRALHRTLDDGVRVRKRALQPPRAAPTRPRTHGKAKVQKGALSQRPTTLAPTPLWRGRLRPRLNHLWTLEALKMQKSQSTPRKNRTYVRITLEEVGVSCVGGERKVLAERVRWRERLAVAGRRTGLQRLWMRPFSKAPKPEGALGDHAPCPSFSLSTRKSTKPSASNESEPPDRHRNRPCNIFSNHKSFIVPLSTQQTNNGDFMQHNVATTINLTFQSKIPNNAF